MKFDANSNPPSFASDDQIIEKNTKVRLKIVGTRVDATEIVRRNFSWSVHAIDGGTVCDRDD